MTIVGMVKFIEKNKPTCLIPIKISAYCAGVTKTELIIINYEIKILSCDTHISSPVVNEINKMNNSVLD